MDGYGRWLFCKECDKYVCPELGDGVVMCPICGYGLAPLKETENED